jgi:hypothetical protein
LISGSCSASETHRDDRRRQSLSDVVQDSVVVSATTVDLVHKQHRRHVQPSQHAHEDARLRLHTLDCRDDQDNAVEYTEGAFNLGDEVGVTRSIDQVDYDAPNRERHDCSLDRDATRSFKIESVGLCSSSVDAADLFDDPG